MANTMTTFTALSPISNRRSAQAGTAVVSALVLSLALTGCSFSIGATTVPIDEFARAAAGLLEAEVDGAVELDCGTDDVDLVVDAEYACLAYIDDLDPVDAVVTITEVEGTKYSINVVTSG